MNRWTEVLEHCKLYRWKEDPAFYQNKATDQLRDVPHGCHMVANMSSSPKVENFYHFQDVSPSLVIKVAQMLLMFCIVWTTGYSVSEPFFLISLSFSFYRPLKFSSMLQLGTTLLGPWISGQESECTASGIIGKRKQPPTRIKPRIRYLTYHVSHVVANIVHVAFREPYCVIYQWIGLDETNIVLGFKVTGSSVFHVWPTVLLRYEVVGNFRVYKYRPTAKSLLYLFSAFAIVLIL